MSLPSDGSRRRTALVLGLLVGYAGCNECPVDPDAPRTERYVISMARADDIMAGRTDGGTGTTCEDECMSLTRFYGGFVSACGADSRTDAGVILMCTFTGPFCD